MYLFVAHQSKVGCFCVGLPRLGPMPTDSLLGSVHASAVVTAITCITFTASVAACVIACVISCASAVSASLSVSFENTCLCTFSVFTWCLQYWELSKSFSKSIWWDCLAWTALACLVVTFPLPLIPWNFIYLIEDNTSNAVYSSLLHVPKILTIYRWWYWLTLLGNLLYADLLTICTYLQNVYHGGCTCIQMYSTHITSSMNKQFSLVMSKWISAKCQT